MATYKGVYTIPYKGGTGGKYSFPFFELDETDISNGRINVNGLHFEGSTTAYSEDKPSVYVHTCNKIQIFDDYYFGYEINNGTEARPYIHKTENFSWTNAVASLGDLAHYDKKQCCTSFLCKYGNEYYVAPNTYRYSDDNSTIVKNFACSIPHDDIPGYYVFDVISNRESWVSIVNIADATFIDYLNNNLKPFIPETDPFSPGGNTETGGGTGSFDGTGDNIDIPSLPTLSAVDTGFITIFNPSIAQLKDLANYMWNGSLFDLNTWQKLFANPMDAILGLSIVPVAVPNGGTGEVKVGNISTNISMTKAASQYVEVDCGTINVNEYWGAYLDYDPYTKAEIYLPYCGIHPIATDDIMGKAVHVVYHVDVLSGSCCAYVKCGGSVLYSFIGQCASSIPISGTDFTNIINGAINAAVSVGSMAATGGATAPLVAPQFAQMAVNSAKPSIEKSGAISGTGAMMAVQTPYLILTRPRQALPERQNTFTGYPSFITESLGDLSGYTEIEEIHLENISATESELSEIENLLKSGVIF